MNNGADIGLINITFRVMLIYLLLLVSMRIMGKREVGQLSNLDFVVAIVIAELATLPLTDRNLTVIHSVVPMMIITALQVSVSLICLKSNKFRRLLYGIPNMLIAEGNLQMKEMRKARYNIDDLLSQLRQKDIFDVGDVDYAVLETSGELTVLLKNKKQAVTKDDLHIQVNNKYRGIALTLIDDGEVNWKGLSDNHLDKAWLMAQLKKEHVNDPKDVFYASLSNDGTIYFITRRTALQTKQVMR